ncbi:MAG TPA: hypothetical protein VMS00_10370 [Acidimicrobiales bacterium]|nr:hypothetical protein [Acidimicrobiales bacterium]
MPGPYSGSNGEGWGITFYVSRGGKSVENLSMPTTSESCTPSGNTNGSVGVLQVAIRPNGSFSTTTSENGVLNSSSVKITDTFTGQFQAATASAGASAAGTWRENIAYASGTTAACTSNTQSWKATLYTEPPWNKSVVKPGNYSGSNGEGWGITFSVAPGGASILNVSLPTTAESCIPSSNINTPFTLRAVAVQPNGSFTTSVSESGVINSYNARITYTFAGYFEGPTPSGPSTVAGAWRENVVFASGTTAMCTSNYQSWTATLQG